MPRRGRWTRAEATTTMCRVPFSTRDRSSLSATLRTAASGSGTSPRGGHQSLRAHLLHPPPVLHCCNYMYMYMFIVCVVTLWIDLHLYVSIPIVCAGLASTPSAGSLIGSGWWLPTPLSMSLQQVSHAHTYIYIHVHVRTHAHTHAHTHMQVYIMKYW